MPWFVVETNVQAERSVRDLLTRFGAFLPTYQREVSHARRTVWRESVLFPNYLFVHCDMDAEEHSRIATTRGVRCVLGGPTPIRSDAMDAILERCGLLHDELKAGEKVSAGVFTGLFVGSDGDRVKVLLSLFGRDCEKDFPKHAVKRVA